MVTFLSVGVLLVAFGYVTLIGGLGVFVLPLGVALVVSTPIRHRPWIVVGLIAGALALSLGYAASAPWSCWGGSLGTGCSRALLPDLDRAPQPGDYWLALGVASAAAVVAGVTVARPARRTFGRESSA